MHRVNLVLLGTRGVVFRFVDSGTPQCLCSDLSVSQDGWTAMDAGQHGGTKVLLASTTAAPPAVPM